MTSQVLPYFRAVMKALGHTEWKDPLNDENIPDTIINRAYHLRLGDASSIKQNQTAIEVNQPIQVRLFVKGYKASNETRDRAVEFMDAIVQRSLNEARRNASTYTGIKNVSLVNSLVDELAQSNDNTMRVTVNFNVYLIMASIA